MNHNRQLTYNIYAFLTSTLLLVGGVLRQLTASSKYQSDPQTRYYPATTMSDPQACATLLGRGGACAQPMAQRTPNLEQGGEWCLPDGLPSTFAGDGGFDRLCEFLEIATRRRKQAICANIRSKYNDLATNLPQKLSTAKRLQQLLTHFYASASACRQHWRKPTNTADINKSRSWPSLEYRALISFDVNFQDHEIEAAALDRAIATFPDIVSSIHDLPAWQRTALAVWPALQDKVLGWDAMDERSRSSVTRAIFAVATILDDVRLLWWAADRVESLASEFAFADNGSNKASEPDSDTSQQRLDYLMRRWRYYCCAVSGLASALEDRLPDEQIYDEFRRHVTAMKEIRDPARSIIQNRSALKHIQNLEAEIGKFVTNFNATWLQQAAGIISSYWKETYLNSDPVDSNKLLSDYKRAIEGLSAGIAKWKSAAKARYRLSKELSCLLSADQDDLSILTDDDNREEQLQQQLQTLKSQIRQAMKNTLDTALPDGQTHNWNKLSRDQLPPVTPDHDTDQIPPIPPENISEQSEPVDGTEDVENKPPKEPTKENDKPGPGDTRSSKPQGQRTTIGSSTTDITKPPRQPNGGTIGPDDRLDEINSPREDDVQVQVLWTAVRNRPGIAFHLSRLLSEHDCDHPALPPSDLIAALILARFTQPSDENVAMMLKQHIACIDPTALTRKNSSLQDSLNLLLFCATVSPSLVAPATGAASLLRATSLGSDEMKPVYDLAQDVADRADQLGRSVRFDSTLIRAVLNQANWSRDFENTRARASDWLKKALRQRNIYKPAHRVWIQLLRETETLGKLARMIAEADTRNREPVETLYNIIIDEQSFTDLIRNTDRKIRGRKRPSIGGRALRQLRRHAQPLCDLTLAWLRIVDAKSQSTGFVERIISSLDQSVQRLGRQSLDAIDAVYKSSDSLEVQVSIEMTKQAVSNLCRLFRDSNASPHPSPMNSAAILSRDLLFVHTLDIDSQYWPIPDQVDILEQLTSTRDHAETMSDAFNARLHRGDLVGSNLACLELEFSEDPEAHRSRKVLEQTFRRHRVKLIDECNSYKEVLEQSLHLRQIDENTAETLRTKLASAEFHLDRNTNGNKFDSFNHAMSRIREARQAIRKARLTSQDQARSKLKELSETITSGAYSRIERTISDGDLMTADELLSRVTSGQELHPYSENVVDEPFYEFISAVETIDAFVANTRGSLQSKIDAVFREQAGVHFPSMTRDERKEAEQLLTAWYELSVAKCYEKRNLKAVLQAIGLPPRNLTEEKRAVDFSIVALETDLIKDRLRCPLPHFGSEARGRYRLLLNWAKIPRESIAWRIDNQPHDATIVFHFGSLGKDRDWLRNWAITQHKQFVVVDESLAIFLTARPSGRLSALFRCVLPFSDAEPYFTMAGSVPPELFFGRKREQQEIMRETGPCFIYGGRQLGKTALLMKVELEFHRPDREQFAKWIDLKAREIGHARRSAEIWSLLRGELRNLGVRQQSHRNFNPDNPRHIDLLIQDIERWIRDHPKRRLLLLLDEADGFLDVDARNNFRESTRLKGLMDRTQRRVKVVFAGLHNVLRITERANHPLAHLGQPINIGPLLSNGEWIEAHNLVRDPLQAVGYHFSPQDLSTRILAQTNYYPSLIQLYGAELVKHLRDSNQSVPYGVTAEDIAAAYNSNALRDAIRQRFQLTLQLDQRYEVIAYSLAFELLGDNQDLESGLERRDLADCAREWWPAGFDHDDREFNVLLQEMEGLGVLRSVSGTSCHTFRNANVLPLLGSRDEIYQVLEREREAPMLFEPSFFHRRYSDKDASCCPLTFEQEDRFRKSGGVAVISGCSATGIEDIGRFLGKPIDGASFRNLSEIRSLRTFAEQLKSSNLRLRSTTPMTVVLGPTHQQWNLEWVETAREALRRKKTPDRIKVLFVADAEVLWSVMCELEGIQIEPPEWIVVEPWHKIFLRRWLEDHSQPHSSDCVQQLMDISGGWPKALELFVHQKRTPRTWDGRIRFLRRELTKTAEWRSQLGLTSDAIHQLSALLNHQPIRSRDIDVVADLEKIEATLLQRRVQWCSRLGLATKSLDGQWQFNSLLVRLLRSESVE